MGAAVNGKLDCLDHLIAKGAKVHQQNNYVRRRPCCGVAARGVGYRE